jgi:hypothetical protein
MRIMLASAMSTLWIFVYTHVVNIHTCNVDRRTTIKGNARPNSLGGSIRILNTERARFSCRGKKILVGQKINK